MKNLLAVGLLLALFASCSANEQDSASVPGTSAPSALLGLVEVPSIVDQTVNYAAGYLSVIDLVLVVADNANGDAVIVNQIPVEGSWVPAESPIWAVLATAPTTTDVPTTTTSCSRSRRPSRTSRCTRVGSATTTPRTQRAPGAAGSS